MRAYTGVHFGEGKRLVSGNLYSRGICMPYNTIIDLVNFCDQHSEIECQWFIERCFRRLLAAVLRLIDNLFLLKVINKHPPLTNFASNKELEDAELELDSPKPEVYSRCLSSHGLP